MQTLEECVVRVMGGNDPELFPFLPYILQDLWELGSDPDTIITLIRRYFSGYGKLSVLDLGCGKGAVSIKTARELGCRCHGIDAIADFIRFAKDTATQYGVDRLCVFEVGDIRERVKQLPKYDVIILGATGPVLGDYDNTLTAISKCLNHSGMIIIDDAYIESRSTFSHPLILRFDQISQQINAAGMRLMETVPISGEDIRTSEHLILDNLKRRCHELIRKHPEKKKLFEDYIKNQERETDININKVVCVTLAIKKQAAPATASR